MRIVSLVPEGASSSIYRSFIPMQALALRKHRVHVEERDAVGDAGPLLGVDAVHVFRLAHRGVQQLARRLHQAGVAVVWDTDCDFESAPPDHPVGRMMRGLSGQRATADFRSIQRIADVIMVPTEELADRCRAQGATGELHVVENYLPPPFTRPRTLPETGITIGWAGLGEHQWDFERLGIRDVLQRVLERHRHVRLFGLGIDTAIRSPRVEFVPWVGYDDLPVALARCDIAIAPLADVPFNRTRSNVKLKEFAAIGVPWLASPVGDYAWMGEEQGGRLVADGDWSSALELLIRDEDARRRLASAGRRWAAGEVVVDHVGELEKVFARAVELARARGAA